MSATEDETPLLDISNDIEKCSEDWPIDPEGNSVVVINSSEDYLQQVKNKFGKPKRLLLEIFIMLNMAQLIYTAMLAFVKTSLLHKNQEATPSLYLCLYRCFALFAIQTFSYFFFPESTPA